MNQVSNGLGVQVEYSLFRPAENMIPGINILGGFSMAWHTTTQYYAYSIPNPGTTIQPSEETIRCQTLSVGAELYLNSSDIKLYMEPFIQVFRSFSKVFASGSSSGSAANSLTTGFDIPIGDKSKSCFVITAAIMVREKAENSFLAGLSFIFL